MSGKQDKKLRQYFRREYADKAAELAAGYTELNNKFLKPKPKWVPMWAWMFGLRRFVYIKKSKPNENKR